MAKCASHWNVRKEYNVEDVCRHRVRCACVYSVSVSTQQSVCYCMRIGEWGAVAIVTAPGVHPSSVGSARVEDQALSRGARGQQLRGPWVFVCLEE